MGSRRHVIVAVLCMAAACSSSTRPSPPQPSPPRSCKPEAPVDLTLDAVPDGAGGLTLTVRATPTREVDELELSVIGPDGHRLRGAKGARSLARTVAHDGRRSRIAGIATVVVDGVTMTKTIERPVGPPRVQRTRTYALPDGERAREV